MTIIARSRIIPDVVVDGGGGSLNTSFEESGSDDGWTGDGPFAFFVGRLQISAARTGDYVMRISGGSDSWQAGTSYIYSPLLDAAPGAYSVQGYLAGIRSEVPPTEPPDEFISVGVEFYDSTESLLSSSFQTPFIPEAEEGQFGNEWVFDWTLTNHSGTAPANTAKIRLVWAYEHEGGSTTPRLYLDDVSASWVTA